jgi:NADPH:quinone reductase-like Zn-dependent oxidoreductase
MQDVVKNANLFDFRIDNAHITVALLDVVPTDFASLWTDDSVLVRVKAFSCNFRDRSLLHFFNESCIQFSGDRKYFYSPIGSEFMGEVLEVGSHVHSLKIGDRVMPNMAYPIRRDGKVGGVISNFASQRNQLFSEEQLIKVPDKMSDEEAAGFALTAQTAYSMVRKANLRGGENVLLTALSSNTSLAIMALLQSRHVNIYGASTKAADWAELLDNGELKQIFSFEDLKNKHLLEPRFDVVFDPFIDLYFPEVRLRLNHGAQYIYCGLYKQNPKYVSSTKTDETDLCSLYATCIIRNVSLIGNCLGTTSDLENAIADYVAGEFSVPIDSVFSGEDVLSFFQQTFLNKRKGKVIYKYAD